MTTPSRIGTALARARAEKNLTVEEIAAYTNIPAPQLVAIESGAILIMPPMRKRLAASIQLLTGKTLDDCDDKKPTRRWQAPDDQAMVNLSASEFIAIGSVMALVGLDALASYLNKDVDAALKLARTFGVIPANEL